MEWERACISGRPDIIGVRSLESGQRQFLMHNEALSGVYYTATEGPPMYRIEVKVTDPNRKTEGGREDQLASVTCWVTHKEAFGPHGTEFARRCIAPAIEKAIEETLK